MYSTEIVEKEVVSNTSIETLEGASTGIFERFIKN